MRKIIAYEIRTGGSSSGCVRTLDDLCKEISNAIYDGFEPLGGVCLVFNPVSQKYNAIQAIVRYEDVLE